MAEAEDKHEDAEELADVPEDGQWFQFFLQFLGAGPFKARFCVYFLSVTAFSQSTRLACTDELERVFAADLGTGETLMSLCTTLAGDLPAARKESA